MTARGDSLGCSRNPGSNYYAGLTHQLMIDLDADDAAKVSVFHSLWVGKAGGELLRGSPLLSGASVLSASRLEPLVPFPLASPARFSRSVQVDHRHCRPAANETVLGLRRAVGTEVVHWLGANKPEYKLDPGFLEHPRLSPRAVIGPGARFLDFLFTGPHADDATEEEEMELLHRRCCGLDVHKETVVACLRIVSDGKVTTEVRTFQTTTADLLRLSEWLAANDCTHVAMEATGVYWKPVWHILDDGEFALVLANAAHVKECAGPQDRRQRCDVAGRTVGARSDPGELRAGRPDPGDAQPAAHAETIGP